ncbi:MAG: Kelch repeat-containing protein [Solirubrobacteraceae bacterium]
MLASACTLGLTIVSGCSAVTGAGSATLAQGASATHAASKTSTSATSSIAPRPARARLVLRASVIHWRLPAPVSRTVAAARGERIYVFGGHDAAGATVDTVDELNLHTGRTTVAGALALPTHGAAAAALGGQLLVFGGASNTVHDVVQQFHPRRRAARVIARLPTPRADVTAAVVGHTVVLVGGFDGIGPQRDVWASRGGLHFHAIAALRQPVRYPAVVADDNNVYVFGGLISGGEYDGQFSNLIQRVHLGPHPSVTIAGRLPMPLAHAMGALIDGRILVIGGSTTHGPSAAILRFDPGRDHVRLAGRLPHPVTDAAVATVAGTAYLLGGISTQPLASVIAVRLAPAAHRAPRSAARRRLPRHYENQRLHIAVRYPAGWRISKRTLTRLVSPRQLLVVSSFPIRQHHPDPNCTPQTALSQMPPGGALLLLFEQQPPQTSPSARRFFGPRPIPFDLEQLAPRPYECFGLSRAVNFHSHGREIELIAYFGPSASPRTLRLADQTLDSLSLTTQGN